MSSRSNVKSVTRNLRHRLLSPDAPAARASIRGPDRETRAEVIRATRVTQEQARNNFPRSERAPGGWGRGSPMPRQGRRRRRGIGEPLPHTHGLNRKSSGQKAGNPCSMTCCVSWRTPS